MAAVWWSPLLAGMMAGVGGVAGVTAFAAADPCARGTAAPPAILPSVGLLSSSAAVAAVAGRSRQRCSCSGVLRGATAEEVRGPRRGPTAAAAATAAGPHRRRDARHWMIGGEGPTPTARHRTPDPHRQGKGLQGETRAHLAGAKSHPPPPTDLRQ